jgi:hypothetical protein
MILSVAAALKTSAEYSLVPYEPGRALPHPRQTAPACFATAGESATPRLYDYLPNSAGADRPSRQDHRHATYSFRRTIEHPAQAATGTLVDIFV